MNIVSHPANIGDPILTSAPISEAPASEAAVSEASISEVAETDTETDAPTAEAPISEALPERLDLVSTRIPHIAIHVFAEKPEFSEVWQRTSSDRRLAAAKSNFHQGGLGAAIALYQAKRSPDLIIVETDSDEDELCLRLDALADLCRPGTRVILIGRQNDIQLYQKLLDMGVSSYLVAPVSVARLITSIAELYRDPNKAGIGRIMAVLGAKGGVGTSMVAQSLALKLGLRHGADALLADLDIAFGAGLLESGFDRSQGLVELLRDPDRVDAEMLDRLSVRRGTYLALLGAAADLDSGFEIESTAIERVLDVARTHFCRIVLDVPHLWSPWAERLLIAADDVLIVSTPELASLSNAATLIGRVRTLRPNDGMPLLVLNQTGMPRRREITKGDIAKALGFAPTISIPFDPKAFSMAAVRNRMVADIARRRPLGRACDRLAELVDQEAPAPAGKNQRRRFLGAMRGRRG